MVAEFEVHLAITGILVFFGLYFIVVCMDAVYSGHLPQRLSNIVSFFASSIASSVALTSLLSIVRNIKRKNFIGSSVIFRVVRWCWKTFVKVLVWLRSAFVEYR